MPLARIPKRAWLERNPIEQNKVPLVIHTNIYKTLRAPERAARGGERSRRTPVIRTHRTERHHGPRRALRDRLAEVVRKIRHEGHELERLDDVEGAVAIVA